MAYVILNDGSCYYLQNSKGATTNQEWQQIRFGWDEFLTNSGEEEIDPSKISRLRIGYTTNAFETVYLMKNLGAYTIAEDINITSKIFGISFDGRNITAKTVSAEIPADKSSVRAIIGGRTVYGTVENGIITIPHPMYQGEYTVRICITDESNRVIRSEQVLAANNEALNIKSVSFENGSGEEIRTIYGEESLTVFVAIENISSFVKSPLLVVSAKDKGGTVLKAISDSESITGVSNGILRVNFGEIPKEIHNVYIMIWEDGQSIKPIYKSVRLN